MEEKTHTEHTGEHKTEHHNEHDNLHGEHKAEHYSEHKVEHHSEHDNLHGEHKTEHHSEHKPHTEHKAEHHSEHKEGHVHHAYKEHKKIKKSKLWMIVSGILAVLLMASIFTGGFKGKGSSTSVGTEEFIFLGSDACTTACDEMEPVTKEMVEKAGLTFSKAKYFQPVQVPGYLLIKDGVVSLNAIQDKATLAVNLCEATGSDSVCSEASSSQAEVQQEISKSAEEKCESLEKVDKPKLEVFYVSRCPFGVQAINSLYYVAKNFGDDVEVIPRLLVNKAADGKSTTSMHGEQEHIEDLRQICLREEQLTIFWDYINCYSESGDGASCETSTKVDSKKLDDCFENRAEEYALVDADDWEKIYEPKGGSGSPSFFLNGERISEYDFSSNGRSPDNVKNIICCSAKGEIKGCENTLQTAQPPRGFGKIEAGSDAGSEQLNC